jgi:hypothetical protein
MKKIIFIFLVIGLIGQTIAQNPKNKTDLDKVHQYIKERRTTNLKKVHQYIKENDLAICAKNYKFIGVYIDQSSIKATIPTYIISVFMGDYDLINERKIIASKIYYVAGLTKCSDKEFNDTSSPTTKFPINLGNNLEVRYYNFNGNVSYKNRNLIHFQTTDILNPKHMNAMFKGIDVVYDNVYFPKAYGLDYKYDLKFPELAKNSMEVLYKDFQKIETEYKKL